VSAYKGEGKSALLKFARHQVSLDAAKRCLVINIIASDISPSGNSVDFEEWVRLWKRAIMGKVAVELGCKIGVAIGDDAVSLVEEARSTGFRSHGLVGGILRRVTLRAAAGTPPANVSMSVDVKQASGVANSVEIVNRNIDDDAQVWLFIDDIDREFKNEPIHRIRVGAFLIAALELTSQVCQLKIRTSIRPNVWKNVSREFAALSHVRENIRNIEWREDDLRGLLARRVEGYFIRTEQYDKVVARQGGMSEYDKECDLISYAFMDPMYWGGRERPPYIIVYTLSMHRPRWAVELCKHACAGSTRMANEPIGLEDMTGNYSEFGQNRIDDTVAEFCHQCSLVGELIDAFKRQPEEFGTDELIGIINKRIAQKLNVMISGVPGRASATDIASFLFEVGLYYGRRDNADGTYCHYRYADSPTLLRSRTSIDAGLRWEVHPVFRQVLEMRDANGNEVKVRNARLYRYSGPIFPTPAPH
jgi:hypothetical protein